jgi:hypothetical protein
MQIDREFTSMLSGVTVRLQWSSKHGFRAVVFDADGDMKTVYESHDASVVQSCLSTNINISIGAFDDLKKENIDDDILDHDQLRAEINANTQ